jgi:hypothetical protein
MFCGAAIAERSLGTGVATGVVEKWIYCPRNAAVFTKVDYTLGSLMDAIGMGTIGLPDIQRPFVWKNSKVRNLFDSMYRGYPVGYLLLWENSDVEDSRTIGVGQKQKVPHNMDTHG